jgi:hypothetical protein
LPESAISHRQKRRTVSHIFYLLLAEAKTKGLGGKELYTNLIVEQFGAFVNDGRVLVENLKFISAKCSLCLILAQKTLVAAGRSLPPPEGLALFVVLAATGPALWHRSIMGAAHTGQAP